MTVQELEPQLRAIARRRARSSGAELEDLEQEARCHCLELIHEGWAEPDAILASVRWHLYWASLQGLVRVPPVQLGRAKRGELGPQTAAAVREALAPMVELPWDLPAPDEEDPSEGIVDGLLNALSPELRVAFELHAMNGLSLADVGRELGCSKTNAARLVEAARHHLRVLLDR